MECQGCDFMEQYEAVTQSQDGKLVYVGAGIDPGLLTPLAEITLYSQNVTRPYCKVLNLGSQTSDQDYEDVVGKKVEILMRPDTGGD